MRDGEERTIVECRRCGSLYSGYITKNGEARAIGIGKCCEALEFVELEVTFDADDEFVDEE